tara:strand:- start:444 stop:947 length:504 start_codon:yes stop_codon:yes gene_type:complete
MNQTSITQFFFKNKSTISKTLYIYTDGACTNNGKRNAKAGIGIYSPNLFNISEKLIGHQTNQRAELYAILKALQLTDILEYDSIHIYTDSMYSINCLTKWIFKWIKNDWLDFKKKPVKNKDLILQIYTILYNHNHIHLHHILAHTNKTDTHSIGNSYADDLARKSIN